MGIKNIFSGLFARKAVETIEPSTLNNEVLRRIQYDARSLLKSLPSKVPGYVSPVDEVLVTMMVRRLCRRLRDGLLPNPADLVDEKGLIEMIEDAERRVTQRLHEDESLNNGMEGSLRPSAPPRFEAGPERICSLVSIAFARCIMDPVWRNSFYQFEEAARDEAVSKWIKSVIFAAERADLPFTDPPDNAALCRFLVNADSYLTPALLSSLEARFPTPPAIEEVHEAIAAPVAESIKRSKVSIKAPDGPAKDALKLRRRLEHVPTLRALDAIAGEIYLMAVMELGFELFAREDIDFCRVETAVLARSNFAAAPMAVRSWTLQAFGDCIQDETFRTQFDAFGEEKRDAIIRHWAMLVASRADLGPRAAELLADCLSGGNMELAANLRRVFASVVSSSNKAPHLKVVGA